VKLLVLHDQRDESRSTFTIFTELLKTG